MQIKVRYKDAVKGIQRKQKNFTKRLMSDIHGEAARQMSQMNLPRVTSHLHDTYGASRTGNKVTFGSGGSGGGAKPAVYANWIETGKKRKGVKRKGYQFYRYYTSKGNFKWVMSTLTGIGEFKRKKEEVIKQIPRIARKLNINKL